MTRPLRGSLLALLAVLPAMAQFQGLATDHTGSRVWFSSALAQKGTQQHNREKIFAANADGAIELIAQRPLPEGDRLLRPQVSGDGQTLVYGAEPYCPPGITCRVAEPYRSIVSMAGRPDREFIGRVAMSRNGRYLLRHSYAYFGPTGQVELIDLETGATVPWAVSGFQSMDGATSVTSSGAALVYSQSLWLLHREGVYDFVPNTNFQLPPENFDWERFGYPWAAIDDSGTRVVQPTTIGAPSLIVTAPGVESQPRLLVGPEEGASSPVLSADGSLVLFLSRADFDGSNAGHLQQAWIIEVESGDTRPATNDPAGIAEAALSGNGRVVWAATFAGRLLRVDLDDGGVDEIIPQTTFVPTDPLGYPFVTAPGALLTVTGRGLAPRFEASGIPLATNLAGVELSLEGEPLPLLYVSPTEIRAQIPWELRGSHTLLLKPTESPFDAEAIRRVPIRLEDSRPWIERTADYGPLVAHGDFRGLVTAADPARPGEVLHLYLSGLGPVDPPVATGHPAPLDTLSFLIAPIQVFLSGENLPAFLSPEVLFVGLAPGLVGIYQLSIRLPGEILSLPPEIGISVQGDFVRISAGP